MILLMSATENRFFGELRMKRISSPAVCHLRFGLGSRSRVSTQLPIAAVLKAHVPTSKGTLGFRG